MERIEDSIHPVGAQQDAFVKLKDATGKAVEILQSACPDVIALTPVGRIAQMEKRLDAMLQSAKTLQPALEDFYASLSNEQKARFSTRLAGRPSAAADGSFWVGSKGRRISL